MNPLYVVTMVSNPVRYKSRYRLARQFQEYVRRAGVQLLTVEVAFGERPHEVTEAGNPWHVQLRTSHELWHKENALNVGVQHLSRQVPDWRYVAWVDADVTFARHDWAEETVHQLQHHRVVQMFSHCVDMDPNDAPTANFYGPNMKPASWAYCHAHGLPRASTSIRHLVEKGRMNVDDLPTPDYGMVGPGHYWHPGFAWACRRQTWDELGGLIDFSILGAADHLMASCITGHLDLLDWFSKGYRRRILEWRDRAERYVRRDLGYVPGLLLHHWHGRKTQRGYKDRWKIFHEHGFDPDLDVKRDAQGLYQLTDRSIGLRDDLRKYHRARNEDSIDV